MSLCILIGADVAPTESNLAAFQSGAGAVLSDGLAEVWRAADARLFNLETPLADRKTPAHKCGPCLRSPAGCARGIAALRPTAVSLCNNHILDHGEAGLCATVEALAGAGVSSFGAGPNLKEAEKPFYFTHSGVRMGVYAVCEHEFSVATEQSAGANPLDLLELGERVRAARAGCDHLIALYHGGREGYPYPSPALQKACRKMAECGASLVLCQHSHCVGSFERYHGATIVYGQGNFIFDVDDGGACFDTGLLVRLEIEGGGAETVDFVPLVRARGGAALAHGERAREILDGFFARSERVPDEAFVCAKYEAYAAESKEKLLKVFLSGNPALRTLNVLYGRRPTRVYPRETKTAILNTLLCESIRELLTEGLYHDVF